MPAGDERDPALKTALPDFDVARRDGEDPAILDEEGLRGVRADRNLTGDGDARPVEDALANFDAARVFVINSVSPAQVDQPGFEMPGLFRQCPGAGR